MSSRSERELERLIGAVIAPEWRVGSARPSREYLRRFPPHWVLAFGRSLETRGTLPGLAAELRELRAFAALEGLPRPAVCCDLEEGAGLHFPEGTRLPPALALAAADGASSASGARAGDVAADDASTDDPNGGDANDGRARASACARLDALARAAECTAREARALGVELVLAPVVDVNTRRDNPIIATRSLGDTPDDVAARASAWLRGLARGGALGCLKHFPGHGDTEHDSHSVLPLVSKARAELDAVELAPFRSVIAARPRALGAVMVAHLDVPALGGRAGVPTSLSDAAVRGVLRGELGWDGLVMTDGLAMGALARFDAIHVRALNAGCDVLLGPPDAARAADELRAALRDGTLSLATLEQAAARAAELAQGAASAPSKEPDWSAHAALADDLCDAAITRGPGAWRRARGETCELVVVHGAAADPVQRLDVLREHVARESRSSEHPSSEPAAHARGGHGRRSGGDTAPRVFAAACVVGCGRGRAGLEPEVERELLARIDAELEQRGRARLLWFGSPQVLPPRLWDRRGLELAILYAPSEPLQRAAARLLMRDTDAAPSGRLPVAAPASAPDSAAERASANAS